MQCSEVMEIIEQACPKHAALEWDNVGLLAGRAEREVNSIYVALDATDEVIEDALGKGADMLITHHPMIFAPLKSITDGDFIGSRVIKLIRNDISCYAMHTNYDVMRMGELASMHLGIMEEEVLEATYERIDGQQEGIGRIGELPQKMTLEECCKLVKEKFGLECVKVFGDLKQQVSRAAISPGSGKSMIGTALFKGADVLITGDIDHHEGIDAYAQGMSVIDAGHYGLEHIFIADMKRFLEERLVGVEVNTAEIRSPFQIL